MPQGTCPLSHVPPREPVGDGDDSQSQVVVSAVTIPFLSTMKRPLSWLLNFLSLIQPISASLTVSWGGLQLASAQPSQKIAWLAHSTFTSTFLSPDAVRA